MNFLIKLVSYSVAITIRRAAVWVPRVVLLRRIRRSVLPVRRTIPVSVLVAFDARPDRISRPRQRRVRRPTGRQRQLRRIIRRHEAVAAAGIHLHSYERVRYERQIRVR